MPGIAKVMQMHFRCVTANAIRRVSQMLLLLCNLRYGDDEEEEEEEDVSPCARSDKQLVCGEKEATVVGREKRIEKRKQKQFTLESAALILCIEIPFKVATA